ncbi:MAG: nuclear transport factor 2 family protein [Nevskiaceae bacterium]|jgi:ketosteroid isomerase-like protein|nr:nuclear transport factor 2 family protein [Nevskiaceae bacterium]
MNNVSNRRIAALFGALGVAVCLMSGGAATAQAQEITAATLVDRAQIQDLITRYYYNFGREDAENFADFYATDAELILGERHYKGKEGIMSAYGRAPGQEPRPRQERFSFNVSISNPLIVVHGNTATAKMIFTEYVIEKQGDQPKVIVQGREYAHFVKEGGQWRYKVRQITPGMQEPKDWKE